MAPITAAQLSTLFPDAPDDYLQQVAAELNTNLTAYGLDTPLCCAHFFAQVMQETGAGLEARTEILRYDAKGLTLFGYYLKHPDQAAQDAFVRNPATKKLIPAASPADDLSKQQTIANKAYSNEYGNGAPESGDGWRFRGRGLIQVTFRDNYAALAKQYKLLYGASDVDFEANPDLVAEFPYSVRSAVCYWIQHGLQKLAAQGDSDDNVNAITHVINARTDSKALRCANFHKAITVFQ